jgi:hypothetical protein
MTLQSLDNKVIEEFGFIGNIAALKKKIAERAKRVTSNVTKAASTNQKAWKPPASQKTKTDDSDSAFGIPGLDSILGPIKEFFENLISNMKSKIGGTLDRIVNIKETIVDKLSGLFDPLVKKFEGPLQNIMIAGALLVFITILGQVIVPIFSYLMPVDCPKCSCPSCPPKLSTV